MASTKTTELWLFPCSIHRMNLGASLKSDIRPLATWPPRRMAIAPWIEGKLQVWFGHQTLLFNMVYELRVWFMNRRELNQDSIFLIDHKTTGTSSKLFFSISAVLLSQYDPTRISIFILPLKRYIFGPYLDQGFSMAIWPYYALLMNQYVALFFFVASSHVCRRVLLWETQLGS